jgi:methylenetetrahydrofolate--tRNA-(uracil-5-)-methyltransferase
MKNHFGDEFLYFFDAIAPIIDTESINTEIAWKADRYGKGTDDYYNCPLNKEEYNRFIEEIQNAKKIEPKHFETTNFFEGCMPIEVMVDRGPQTLRFGPMKPIGLDDPRTGRYPWAVVQLRQDNKEGTAFNMVGFQTRMAYAEQVRIFRMIPGLENAEFLKLGSIHRNLFVNSPKRLNKDLSSKNDPWLFFAGQITGVEGYFESTCVGLMVAHFLNQKLKDQPFTPPPRLSAMGSLLEAITDPTRAENFQPTNINFALLPPLPEKERDKEVRKKKQLSLAKEAFEGWSSSLG